MMQNKKNLPFSFIKSSFALLLFLVFTSCSAESTKEELFVKALADTSLSSNEKLLVYKKALKSKNTYIAEKAALESLQLNPQNDVLKRAKKIAKQFPSSVPLLSRLIEIYLEQGRFSDAQKLLEKSFFENEELSVKILKIRLLIAQKKDYEKELIDLFTQEAIGNELLVFNSVEFLEELPKELSLLLQLRFAVYERNYALANRLSDAFVEAVQLSDKQALLYKRQILSDIGKAYLYGSLAYESKASFFESIARSISQKENEESNYEISFIAYFYAARLLERLGSSQNTQVLELYELSWKNAFGADYDNALWYYLNLLEKNNPSLVLKKIDETIDFWFDPSYFSDILERLCYRFLSEKKWQSFYELYKIIEDKADTESQARFAYLSARLLQEGFLTIPLSKVLTGTEDALEEKKALIDSLFSKAFYENHSSLYYRILAAEKLDIPIEDDGSHLYANNRSSQNESNKQLEEALLLYAKYGLYDEVYSIFFEQPEAISIKTAVELSKYFAQNGEVFGKLYPMSIRLVIRSANSRNEALTKDILMAMYPRFFSKKISESAAEFELEEYLLYALVRSESLFEKDVISHAGAIGLAQLMKPTAGDIARKLRLTDYDLLDAQTNLRFGAFYLRELLGRLDDSVLLALSSYNAGITRVRNWARENQLPLDLFLETIPFAETREYGKKILSAAAMYGYLYYGSSSHEIVEALLQ